MNSQEFPIETYAEDKPNRVEVKSLNSQVLANNINQLIGLVQLFGVDGQFAQNDTQQQGNTGKLVLDEVTLAVRIASDGQVVLLGSGQTNGSAIVLRFKQSGTVAPMPMAAAQSTSLPTAETLISAAGIDYSRLNSLLAANQWQSANQETWDLLCQILQKNKGSYLSADEIQKIPCAELTMLDRLWQKYSQGRYGFSMQKRVLTGK